MHPHRRRLRPTTLRTLTIDSAAAMVPESVVLIRRFLLFVAVCLSCLLLYNDSNALRFLPRFSSSPSVLFSAYNSALVSGEHRLQKVLKDAAMEDGTVILTTLNEAWAAPNSIIDLFLESFKIGVGTPKLLNHLVIIALDQKAFQRCLELHTHCFALITRGVDFRREAYFMTPHYLKMMWARIDFLRSVLEMGYNFVFTNWKQFMSLRPNLKKYLILPWGVPQNCSLDSLHRYDAPESSNPHDLQD